MKKFMKATMTCGVIWLWMASWCAPFFALAYFTATPYFNKTAKYVVPILMRISNM